MLEKDIQKHIYDNPSLLFPGKLIQEKAMEFSVQGKRIDLLFVVDGQHHIVELKRTMLNREHIGQVVEYYCRLKDYLEEPDLKMILATAGAPSWARHLSDLGIRFVKLDWAEHGDEVSSNTISLKDADLFPQAFFQEGKETKAPLIPVGSKPPSILNSRVEVGSHGEEWVSVESLNKSQFASYFGAPTREAISVFSAAISDINVPCMVQRRGDNALIFVPQEFQGRKTNKNLATLWPRVGASPKVRVMPEPEEYYSPERANEFRLRIQRRYEILRDKNG